MKSDSGKLLILVEGVGDKRFLEDVCSAHVETEVEIITISGKPNWRNELYLKETRLRENTKLNGRNVIILDADNDSASTLASQITEEAIKQEISIESFAFPDNHSTGDLESLLLEIVPTENQGFITCWQKYLECIIEEVPNLEIPNRKETISAYLSWFYSDKSKMSPGKRDYSTSPLWDLNHSVLDPLIQFLKGE